MRGIGTMVLSAGLVLLPGCASMTVDECLSGNWARVGYQDGAAGYPPGRLANHEAACAAHGIGVDAQTYFDARQDGLHEYCTPYRGYHAGSNGQNYAGVCPVETEGGFLAGYADGRVVYDARQYVDQARSEVSTVERRIRNLRKDMDRSQERIGGSDISESERRGQRTELQRLRGELRRADGDLVHARRREQNALAELDRVMRRYPPIYGGGW